MKGYIRTGLYSIVVLSVLLSQSGCNARNPYLPSGLYGSLQENGLPGKECPSCDVHKRLPRQTSGGSGSMFSSIGELAGEFIRRGGLQAVLAMAESNNKMETLTRILGAHITNNLSQSMITKLINRFSGNKGSSGGSGGYAPAPASSGGNGGFGGKTSSSSGTGYVPTPGKTPGAANPDDTEY